MKTPEDRDFPLSRFKNARKAGPAAVGLLTLVLAGTCVVAPPRPVLAAPATVSTSDALPTVAPTALPTASTSPSAAPVPGASPSAGSASPAPGASPSPNTGGPSPTPSGSASPQPSGSPSTSPSSTPSSDAQAKMIQMIVHRTEHLNPKLKDFTSDVTISGEAHLGPILSVPLNLHGKSYHKAPNHYRIDLNDLPDLLKRYQQMLGYRPIHLADYNATMLPDAMINGRPHYVLRLDKKGAGGDFRGETVWVDKKNFTSTRRLYSYTKNGQIDVTFHWRRQKGYIVLRNMQANLSFPGVGSLTATLNADYTNYQFNTGLDSSVFGDKTPASPTTSPAQK